QQAISARTSQTNAVDLLPKLINSFACAEATDPEEFSYHLGLMWAESLNTTERLAAFVEFDNQLGGQRIGLPSVATPNSVCTFDWAALPPDVVSTSVAQQRQARAVSLSPKAAANASERVQPLQQPPGGPENCS